MNTKRALDLCIMLCGIVSIVLVAFYIDDFYKRLGIILVMTVITLVFFLAFLKDGGSDAHFVDGDGMKKREDSISEIILLSEEDTEIARWDIYGKTSIVFGRDERENHVDIDLKDTAFSGMIDREHAVMNYYAGEWYIEDLESENGVRVQKAEEEKKYNISKKYKISSRGPCKIDKGDIIYLGLTKLRVR